MSNDKGSPEFRNEVEISAICYCITKLNDRANQPPHEDMWYKRYIQFLNFFLDGDDIPVSTSLEDIIKFTSKNDDSSLKMYLDFLPGLRSLTNIDELALHNHSWMQMMFNNSEKTILHSIKNENDFNLLFKEDNCFTIGNKNIKIHIESTSRNILNFNWTIISHESETDIHKKNINFTTEKYINYYLNNYSDLNGLEGDDVNKFIEILLF